MKKIYVLLTTIFLTLIGCQEESLDIQEDTILDIVQSTQNRANNSPLYPSNEVVVEFADGLSESDKEMLRYQYGVISFESCPCGDPKLQKWVFGPDQDGSIEEKVFTLKEDDGLEGVDFNPEIFQDGEGLQNPLGSPNIDVAIDKRTSTNEAITFGILDTGVGYGYYKFTNPFLYNSSLNIDACPDDYIGWDFVNNDNDPFDDHGHGTILNSIVYHKMKEYNTDFQVLNAKVFDATGHGEYFKILCGYQYLARNRDMKVINMSFGLYNKKYELLEKFIKEAQKEKLIVTSAGNLGRSTDDIIHYPSGIPVSNLFSVAALAEGTPDIELYEFSNYGSFTVDFAAKGHNVNFDVTPSYSISVSGTSFSAAYASAFSGILYEQGMSVSQHMNQVLSALTYSPNLDQVKYSSHIRF